MKVTDVQQYDESNKKLGVDPPHKGFSATFRTLQGHVEVGVITFTALEITNPQTGVVSFEFDIFSTSRINHGLGAVLNSAINLPRNAQQAVWSQVLQNVSDFMGGKVEDANQVIYKFKYSDYKDQNNQGTTLGTPETTATPEIETKKIAITPKK